MNAPYCRSIGDQAAQILDAFFRPPVFEGDGLRESVLARRPEFQNSVRVPALGAKQVEEPRDIELSTTGGTPFDGEAHRVPDAVDGEVLDVQAQRVAGEGAGNVLRAFGNREGVDGVQCDADARR